MAIYFHQDNPDPFQAGVHAAAALEVGGDDLRRDVAEGILTQSKAKLSAQQQEELANESRAMRRKIEGLGKAAERNRTKKVDFVEKEFRDYVVKNGVLSKKSGKGDIPEVATADISGEPPRKRSKRKKEPSESADPETPSEPKVAATIDVTVPEGSINLLSRIRTSQDSVVGEWTIEDKALLAPFKQKAMLAFNYDTPTEYDLTLIVERRSNSGELVVGFPVGANRAALVIDGERGSRTWLSHDDQNAYLGSLLKSRQPTKIVIQVRDDGLKCLTAEGEVILTAPRPSAESFPDNWEMPDVKRFCLGSELTRFVFHKVMLTPID
jgi:hypothetical protein